jgi:hypothetical protein
MAVVAGGKALGAVIQRSTSRSPGRAHKGRLSAFCLGRSISVVARACNHRTHLRVALSKAVARLRNRRSGSGRPKSVEHGSPEGQIVSRFLGRLATCRNDACLDGRESAVAVRARRGDGDYDDRPRPSGLGRHRYSPGRGAFPPSSGRDSFLPRCCSLAWFWPPRPPIASGSVDARVLGVSSGMRTVPI